MSVNSYAMLIYRPPGLKPRRWLMYDAFPRDSGLQEMIGIKGPPPVLAERHKKLFTSSETRKVKNISYAYLSELLKYQKTIPNNRSGLKALIKDVIDSCNALVDMKMEDIYFVLWITENVKDRQGKVLS